MEKKGLKKSGAVYPMENWATISLIQVNVEEE